MHRTFDKELNRIAAMVSRSEWSQSVLDNLQTLRQAVAAKQYPLPTVSAHAGDEAVKEAINKVFGLPVDRLERLSHSRAVYLGHRQEVLAADCSRQLGLTFDAALPANARRVVREETDCLTWADVVLELDRAVMNDLRSLAGYDLGDSLTDFYQLYLGAATIGNDWLIRELDLLAAILPHVFPAGSLVNEPTAWVLIAP